MLKIDTLAKAINYEKRVINKKPVVPLKKITYRYEHIIMK